MRTKEMSHAEASEVLGSWHTSGWYAMHDTTAACNNHEWDECPILCPASVLGMGHTVRIVKDGGNWAIMDMWEAGNCYLMRGYETYTDAFGAAQARAQSAQTPPVHNAAVVGAAGVPPTAGLRFSRKVYLNKKTGGTVHEWKLQLPWANARLLFRWES